MNWRRVALVVGVLAVVVLVVFGGELAVLVGLETKTATAAPATVEDETAQETGYRLVGTDTETVRRQATVAGVGPTVEVESRVAEYRRQVSLPVVGEVPAAAFVVVSTPQIRTLGIALNPVGRADGRAILDRAEGRYGAFTVDRKLGERTVRTLGKTATVERFRGERTIAGLVTVDLDLHVTTVPHEGDYVVAVGIHPTVVEDEPGRVDRLLRGLAHPANRSADRGDGLVRPVAGEGGRP